MEITGANVATVDHGVTGTQANKIPQSLEAEKNQQGSKALEVSISRKGRELASANLSKTEGTNKVDSSVAEESGKAAGTKEGEDLLKASIAQKNNKGVGSIVDLFA